MADEKENSNALGIPFSIEKPSAPDTFFGSQANLLSQPEFLTPDELYKTPAVINALNILLKSINKNTLDEFDVNVYRAATQLIKREDICHYLNIAQSSLENLAQKSGEIEKISLPENSNEAKNKYNQQEDLAKLQKAVEEHPIILEREREKALTLEKEAKDQKQLLLPKEIEYQRDFLNIITSNELNKDLQTREKGNNSVNNGQTI